MNELDKKRRTKDLLPGLIKGIDSKAHTITAYASTNDWDRYGERFEADAFKDGMVNYKKNTVVLWAHDYEKEPVGKAVDYAFDDRGLILTQKFADTQHANDVFSLYEGGYLNAFSVGFIPNEVKFEERSEGSGEMSLVYVKAELLENSAVPVPANPGALVQKGLMGAAMRLFDPKGEAPAEWKAFEEWRSTQVEIKKIDSEKDITAGADKSLKETLKYLVSLGKMLKYKGKVKDDEVRSMLAQANNICRELIYGVGSPHLEDTEDPMTDEQALAMVEEYKVLSEEMHRRGDIGASDRTKMLELGKTIEKLLQDSVA